MTTEKSEPGHTPLTDPRSLSSSVVFHVLMLLVASIAALGDQVTGLKVGDRVAYAGAPVGAYASERNLPAWRCVKLSAALSDETVAAVFVKGITADMLLVLLACFLGQVPRAFNGRILQRLRPGTQLARAGLGAGRWRGTWGAPDGQ